MYDMCIYLYPVTVDILKNILTTPAVSSTNLASILISASCVVGTCICGLVFHLMGVVLLFCFILVDRTGVLVYAKSEPTLTVFLVPPQGDASIETALSTRTSGVRTLADC